jgi:glycosyltransferase involved in cell wall biosynthesis
MPQSLPNDIQYFYPIKNTQNEYFQKLDSTNVNKAFDGINFRGKTRLLNLQNRSYAILKLIEGNFDIYYQTHYDPYAYKYISKKKKKMTTIHDMNFFVIPEFYINYPFPHVIEWQKISASKADKIITPSVNSKKDIMKTWNIPNDKIEVVYPGNDVISLEEFNLKRIINNPYILFVGNRQEYKNFLNCLNSFKLLSKKNHDLFFICTGSLFDEKEKNIISNLELSNKVLQISADETTMVNLYFNAELFIYPSLYEGFGLPLLEAMTCHCPVICSNTSCFPEVAGNAARYFDPYSIESMFEVAYEILNHPSIRNELIAKGLERIKYFSWEKCANQHAHIYRTLV